MGRAQDQFKSMLQERVAPELRTLGFKGSGQSYTLPDARCFALLGFQKSTSSDADQIRFTINVSVVNKTAWEEAERPRTGTRPSANTYYGKPAWERRIGDFLPSRDDVWWTLRADDNFDELAREVVAAIRDAALPAMLDEMEHQRLAWTTE